MDIWTFFGVAWRLLTISPVVARRSGTRGKHSSCLPSLPQRSQPTECGELPSVRLGHLYLLCQLKRQGLSLDCLSLVCDSLIMSRLMYASLSWSGYLTVECLSTIQKLFTKSVKWAVTSKIYQAADIFAVRDEKVFSAMCTWTNYCLHHLLPSE